MRNIWLITKREYIERVRSKGFVILTLLIPAVMLVTIFVIYLTTQHLGGDKHIVIGSNNAPLALEVRDELAASKAAPIQAVVIAPVTQAQSDEQIARVDAKELDGYLWLNQPEGSAAPEVTYTTRSSADMFATSRIQDAVSNSVMRRQLAERGFGKADVDNVLKQVTVQTQLVKNGKAVTSDSSQSFVAAYVMVLLLYFTVTFFSMNVARSVIQEKTSRIFEVMLATVRPGDMMAGKMIGVGAAALTQIAIWILLGVLAASGPLFAKLTGGTPIHLGVTPLQIAGFCVYFILGFAFYSAVAAGCGAAVNAEQEVQQFSFALVMPMLVAYLSYAYILSSPNAPYSVFLSLFPPTAPIAMFLRLTAQTPPIWQIALSLILMVLAIWGVLWVAARIYRVGILMYGKRPTLPELLRWLRYA
jgi:ABC-2 type transport system permease protein